MVYGIQDLLIPTAGSQEQMLLFSKGVQEYAASSVADSSVDTITNAGCYYDCMTEHDHLANCLYAPGSKQLYEREYPDFARENQTYILHSCLEDNLSCKKYCGEETEEETDGNLMCAGCMYQCTAQSEVTLSKDTIAHSPFAEGMQGFRFNNI